MTTDNEIWKKLDKATKPNTDQITTTRPTQPPDRPEENQKK